MSVIHIRSARKPFDRPRLARAAVAAIARAEAMGLLPTDEPIETLDRSVVGRVAEHVARAGLARGLRAELAASDASAERLEALLDGISDALDESPAPEFEWPRLMDLFGVDGLAKLVGVSPASARRYRAQARVTPDDVAARLHFLALVAGDLAGAYNDVGIRRWFQRKRTRLDGRAPADLLRGGWDPAASGPRRVRELAHALVFAGAT